MIIPAKAYVVKAYGGEWEDSWEDIYAVCLTRETAEQKKKECEAAHNPKISEEEWDKLTDEVEEYEERTEEYFDSFTDGILTLRGKDPNFKWTEEELCKAEDTYTNYSNNYVYSEIVEVDLFE